jgi:hypothetical protein
MLEITSDTQGNDLEHSKNDMYDFFNEAMGNPRVKNLILLRQRMILPQRPHGYWWIMIV